MIPRNQQNRKMQVNLTCPTCGMDLTARGTAGFSQDGETYCCAGCANGTGCICAEPRIKPEVISRRRGAIQQREVSNSPRAATRQRDRSAPQPTEPVKNDVARYPSRKAGARTVPKRKRSVTKERDSQRQQARGRSEFTGSLNRGGATRVSRTGIKSNPRGR